MKFNYAILIPSVLLTLGAVQVFSATTFDLNGDKFLDSIFIEDLGNEKYFRVVDGRSGHSYQTVRINSSSNFLTIIPLQQYGIEDPFFQYFLKIVEDSLCTGIEKRVNPEEALLWLLDDYQIPDTVKHRKFTFRWFADFPNFEPYTTIIDKSKFPYITKNCPRQFVESQFEGKNVSVLFEQATSYLVIYYAQNHIDRHSDGKIPSVALKKSQLIVYKTAHGLIVEQSGKRSWVFITDNFDKLRHPSIDTIWSNGNCIYLNQKSVSNQRLIMIDIKSHTFSKISEKSK